MRSLKKKTVNKSETQTQESEPVQTPEMNSKGTLKKKSSDKEFTCKVRLLDDAQIPLEISIRKSELGKRLFTYVCDAIGDLAESDYFGLRYTDKHNQRQWLDLDRSVYKQMKGCKSYNLSFRVKHYPIDPMNDLKQDLTRYLLYLQIRRDLAQGRLLCPPNMVGRIGALVAQAELGDAPDSEFQEATTEQSDSNAAVLQTPKNTYSPNVSQNTPDSKSSSNTQPNNTTPESSNKSPDQVSYLHNLLIIITQSPKVEAEIMREHKNLRGLTPQEAETELLSRASQLVTYGIDPFPVRPLHKVIIPTTATSTTPSTAQATTNEAGDQNRSSANTSVTAAGSGSNTTEATPVYLPKGTAFYMGITGTGLVTFVGLQRSQEYHWNQIDRLACDKKNFLVYLKKEQAKSEPLTFQCESKSAALALWRWTVDRKCFFTLKQASEAKRLRPSSNIFQRSHAYRFSGRSQQELTTIPIQNTKCEFVRVASLRRVIGSYAHGADASASFGRATLPSRLRPPVELREELRKSDVVEPHTEPATSTESAKPVVIPDTVVEKPAEEESTTAVASKPKAEENQAFEAESPEQAKDEQPKDEQPSEPEIQAKQMPQQLSAKETAATKPEPAASSVEKSKTDNETEVRKRTEPSQQSHSSAYQEVVSALDRTIEKHTESNGTHLPERDTKREKTISSSPNGEVHRVISSSVYQNGPITSKVTELYSRKMANEVKQTSPVQPKPKSSTTETTTTTTTTTTTKKTLTATPTVEQEKTSSSSLPAKMAMAAVTVMFMVGLIVFLETPPTADDTVYSFLRENVLVSTFDSYVYSPVRNTIMSGLAALWS